MNRIFFLFIFLISATTACLLTTSSMAIKHISWNGEYGLISAYSYTFSNGKQIVPLEHYLLTYDGEKFRDLTGESGLKGEGIEAVAWNGKYWLIGSDKGKLVSFDGTSFTPISSMGFFDNSSIEKMVWNGEYWLIYSLASESTWLPGKVKAFSFKPLLVKYDGDKFSPLGEIQIKQMVWNGEYWLLLGKDRLLRYDGTEVTRLDLPMESIFDELDWNGEYFLLGGNVGKLHKYDGAFHELPLSGYGAPLGWNDEYWLIENTVGTEKVLLKYDGSAFTELKRFPIYYDFTKAHYADGQWLIEYVAAGQTSGLMKYYGNEFFDLLDKRPIGIISKVVWAGKYWLIGGKPGPASDKGFLIKYDGKTSEDLTPALKTALR